MNETSKTERKKEIDLNQFEQKKTAATNEKKHLYENEIANSKKKTKWIVAKDLNVKM